MARHTPSITYLLAFLRLHSTTCRIRLNQFLQTSEHYAAGTKKGRGRVRLEGLLLV